MLVAVTKVARRNLPGATRARMMLRELRHEAGVPEPTLLVMLGCSPSALRKWLSGERNPSGAALRCIWLLHRMHAGEVPRTLEDWFLWLPAANKGTSGQGAKA